MSQEFITISNTEEIPRTNDRIDIRVRGRKFYDLTDVNVRALSVSDETCVVPPECLEEYEGGYISSALLERLPNLKVLTVSILIGSWIPPTLRELTVTTEGAIGDAIDCANLEKLKIHVSYKLINTENLKSLCLVSGISEGVYGTVQDLSGMTSLTDLTIDDADIRFKPPQSVLRLYAEVLDVSVLKEMPNLVELEVNTLIGEVELPNSLRVLTINNSPILPDHRVINCLYLEDVTVHHDYILVNTVDLKRLSIGQDFKDEQIFYLLPSLTHLTLVDRPLEGKFEMIKNLEVLDLVHCDERAADVKFPASLKKIIQHGSEHEFPGCAFENVIC